MIEEQGRSSEAKSKTADLNISFYKNVHVQTTPDKPKGRRQILPATEK